MTFLGRLCKGLVIAIALYIMAVSKTCTRLEMEMKGDKRLQKVIQEVMSKVKTPITRS